MIGAGVAIAYFAGDSVMAFAKSLVGKLGRLSRPASATQQPPVHRTGC